MKLSWFCHTNSRQLFCNCPRSRPLFWRETTRDVLSFCCCLKMAENSVSLLCKTNILQLKQTQIIKSLAVQPLKKLKEQCIHDFNLIKYLVPMTTSILWITSFGKLMERPKGKKLRSGNFISFLKTNLGYLSQIVLKTCNYQYLIPCCRILCIDECMLCSGSSNVTNKFRL